MKTWATMLRVVYAFALLFICIIYWWKFRGTSSVDVHDPSFPRPAFVPSIAVSAVIMVIAAIVSGFSATKRSAVGIAFFAAISGMIICLGLLFSHACNPTSEIFSTDRVTEALPWATTFASVFLGLLPSKLSPEPEEAKPVPPKS
ncbi:MAG TPA: hypothetical protein VKT78_08235 [Fimbriimonadaceae bacterium]|nr:hypothetical protein [Fimbriimonadaceae bacterium]